MADETNNRLEEAVRKARALSTGDADIEMIWEDLKESHRLAKACGNELPGFPYWLMLEVSGDKIKRIMHGIYGDNTYFNQYRIIRTAYGKEEKDKWEFYLFFGNIHQKLAKAMLEVAKYLQQHKGKGTQIASFDDIYRSVKRIRDKGRSENWKRKSGKNVVGFNPQDFQKYLEDIRQNFPLDIESDGGSSPQASPRSTGRLAARPGPQTTPTVTQASRDEFSDEGTIDRDSDDSNFIDNENNTGRPAGNDFSNTDANEDMAMFSANMEEPQWVDDGIEVVNTLENFSDDIRGSPEGDVPPEMAPEIDEQTNQEHGSNISLPTGSGTGQGTEDQIRQEVRHASSLLPTVLHMAPSAPGKSTFARTLAETPHDNPNYNNEHLTKLLTDRAAWFKATQAIGSSLAAENAALKKEHHDMLRLRNQAQKEYDDSQQHLRQVWAASDVDSESEAAVTEKFLDRLNSFNKRKFCDELVASVEAKKARLDERIANFISADGATAPLRVDEQEE